MPGYDINSQQPPNVEPYIFTDISGTTKYTGVSVSYGNGSLAVWKIKKEWQVGSVAYMGFPDGEQDFKFIWNNRTTYTYR